MARSEEYRRYSEDCLELARVAEDEKVRRIFLHMAEVWFRLAEHSKANENEEGSVER